MITKEQLESLFKIKTRLEEYYNSDQEIAIWFTVDQELLDGKNALYLVLNNKADKVMSLLDQLDACVYL